MRLIRVDSTLIQAVGYEPERRLLEIAFTSGLVYWYGDVLPETYHALLAADSKGEYFLQHIRGRYPYSRP